MPPGTNSSAASGDRCMGRPHTCDWRDNAAAVTHIIRAYGARHSLRALATRHGCTPALISKILEVHGIERRRGRTPVGLKPGPAGRSATRPRQVPCRPGAHECHWSGQGLSVDQMLAEYLLGSSMAGIGRRHGRAMGTVARLLEAHGIRRRSRAEHAARRRTDLGQKGQLARPVVAGLAKEHGVSARWVRAVLREARPSLPPSPQ